MRIKATKIVESVVKGFSNQEAPSESMIRISIIEELRKRQSEIDPAKFSDQKVKIR